MSDTRKRDLAENLRSLASMQLRFAADWVTDVAVQVDARDDSEEPTLEASEALFSIGEAIRTLEAARKAIEERETLLRPLSD